MGADASKALSIVVVGDVMQQAKGNHSEYSDQRNNDETKQQLDALQSALYCNRSATYYLLKDYQQALTDATMAIKIDPLYIKAYVRKAKALIQLGQLAQACEVLEIGLATTIIATPSSANVLKKNLEETRGLRDAMIKAETLIEHKQFALAKAILVGILGTTAAPNILLATAETDLRMGLLDSVQRFSLQVLKVDAHSVKANALRGHALVLRNEINSGIQWLQQALRYDPDSATVQLLLRECLLIRSTIQDAKDKMFHRQFQIAVDLLTKAISSTTCLSLPPKSPLFGYLYTERASAYVRLKDNRAALKDCSLILYHQDDNVETWLVKFQVLHALGRDEEVRMESAQLLESWGGHDDRIRQAHYKADFEVRKRQRPDFYSLLKVSSLASEREIKKAYRQRALDLHPDRFVGNEYTNEQRKATEQQFQSLGQGLEILTDDFKRQLYDEGYDLEGIEQRVEAAKQAAHRRSDHYHHRGH